MTATTTRSIGLYVRDSYGHYEMVRSFILNVEQRQAIKDYLKKRPSMTSQIRQIRLRAKKLDFQTMESDIELLKYLAALKIPKGRRALDVKASFTVRHKE